MAMIIADILSSYKVTEQASLLDVNNATLQ